MYFLLENMFFLRIVKVFDVFSRKSGDSHSVSVTVPPRFSSRFFNAPDAFFFDSIETIRHIKKHPDKTVAQEKRKHKNRMCFLLLPNIPGQPLSDIFFTNGNHISTTSLEEEKFHTKAEKERQGITG